MWNPYTISYMVLSVLILGVAGLAIYTSISVARKWRFDQDSETQYALEKKVYLIISLMSVGMMIRLGMVPLWFWALSTMIAIIPGSMCLLSVHMLDLSISAVATGLKFLLPLLYGGWQIVNYFNRQLRGQDMMKWLLYTLLPIGILIIIEAVFDLRYLFGIEIRPMSCCGSYFDDPKNEMMLQLTERMWWTVPLFYGLTVILIVAGLLFRRYITSINGSYLRYSRLILFPLGIATVISFFVALHNQVSPLLMQAPFHHCIFCLWEQIWNMPLVTALVLCGLGLFMVYPYITTIPVYQSVAGQLVTQERGLLKWAIWLVTIGSGILLVQIIWTNIFNPLPF